MKPVEQQAGAVRQTKSISNSRQAARKKASVAAVGEHLDTAPIMESRDWFLIREEQPLTIRKDL